MQLNSAGQEDYEAACLNNWISAGLGRFYVSAPKMLIMLNIFQVMYGMYNTKTIKFTRVLVN